MCSSICVWINGWVNKREAGDLRRHRGHYDIIVMCYRNCDRVSVSTIPIWHHARNHNTPFFGSHIPMTRVSRRIHYLRPPSSVPSPRSSLAQVWKQSSGQFLISNSRSDCEIAYVLFGVSWEVMHRCISARLQYHQCWRTGDTAVLHYVLDILVGLVIVELLHQRECQNRRLLPRSIRVSKKKSQARVHITYSIGSGENLYSWT